MFKELGISELFGTGIGEIKRSMQKNGSPDLFYKTFDANDNVTSVVKPVNEEFYEIKMAPNKRKKFGLRIQDIAFSVNNIQLKRPH